LPWGALSFFTLKDGNLIQIRQPPRFLSATLYPFGPGQGAGPNVRTFDPDTYDLLDSFFAGNPGDLSGITL